MLVLKHVRDSIAHVFQLDKNSDDSNLDVLIHNIHFADTIAGSGCIFSCWSNALQSLMQSTLDLQMAVVNRTKQTKDPVPRIWYLN